MIYNSTSPTTNTLPQTNYSPALVMMVELLLRSLEPFHVRLRVEPLQVQWRQKCRRNLQQGV